MAKRAGSRPHRAPLLSEELRDELGQRLSRVLTPAQLATLYLDALCSPRRPR